MIWTDPSCHFTVTGIFLFLEASPIPVISFKRLKEFICGTLCNNSRYIVTQSPPRLSSAHETIYGLRLALAFLLFCQEKKKECVSSTRELAATQTQKHNTVNHPGWERARQWVQRVKPQNRRATAIRGNREFKEPERIESSYWKAISVFELVYRGVALLPFTGNSQLM